jgi:hypothetical protein
VSEKTVFNCFPTKESLILDRLESTVASLRTGLTEPGVSPVEAALRILDHELEAMTSWLAAQDDRARASAAIQRFGTLIQDTPSLRAYQSDMMDQFTVVAATVLAERSCSAKTVSRCHLSGSGSTRQVQATRLDRIAIVTSRTAMRSPTEEGKDSRPSIIRAIARCSPSRSGLIRRTYDHAFATTGSTAFSSSSGAVSRSESTNPTGSRESEPR